MDLEVQPGAGVEAVARYVASSIRHREWNIPGVFTDVSDRVFMNFRPLLRDLGGEEGSKLHHETRWPPVEGEYNWEHRSIRESMWIMADQVDEYEWVLFLKVHHARS